MLNYSKKVLQAVSFHPELFFKELSKATRYLVADEIQKLKTWSLKTFGKQYGSRIESHFRTLP